MPVTLKQLAQHSGVSVPTISQILNEKGHRYSEATCKKVLQAVQDLGYRPNSSARAIRMGRFNCAALLLSTESYRSFLPPPLLHGIHHGLAAKDMHLSIAMLPDEQLTNQNFVPKLMRQWMADGLLVNYHVHAPTRLKELILQYKLPAIWINAPLKQDCVSPNDRQGTRMLTERMIEMGHRNIAYADLTSSEDREPDHISVQDRLGGYCDAMKAAGLYLRVIRPTTKLEAYERAPFAEQELLRPDQPSAAVCYSDTSALVMLQAAAQAGIRVPRDMSIATVSEERVGHSGVPITTAIIPWKQVGNEASRMLMEKIAQPELQLKPRLVSYEQIEGEPVTGMAGASSWSLRYSPTTLL